MKIPFCGPTYEGRSRNVDPTRCINFFPEISVAQDSKTRAALIGTPGTKPFVDFITGEIRLLYNMAGRLFVVVGDSLYQVNQYGTRSTWLGHLDDSSGDVVAADNGIQAYGFGGNQLMLVSNNIGYIYNITTGVFAKITDASFPIHPTTVAYQDGYFVVTDDSMGFYVSEQENGLVWPPLATNAVFSTPDPIQRVISLNQQLYFVKNWSTEIFYNNGNTTYQGCPFSRVEGRVLPFGTPAPKSIAYGLDTIFFIANQGHSGSSEFAGVAMLEGYTPTLISPPNITYKISKLSTITDARGYFYLDEGHSFYVLTFPTDDVTLVYDLSTKMWHERSTANLTDSAVHRHLGQHYTHFYNKHLVSDYRSSKIMDMSSLYYDDDGVPIESVRISPIIYDKGENGSLFIHKLVIDVESGVGDFALTTSSDFAWLADGSYIADGSGFAGGFYLVPAYSQDPTCRLSWSTDSGHTWSNEYVGSIGKAGQYYKRLLWTRLGRARNRVFKLRISDPVKKVVLDAYLNEGSV